MSEETKTRSKASSPGVPLRRDSGIEHHQVELMVVADLREIILLLMPALNTPGLYSSGMLAMSSSAMELPAVHLSDNPVSTLSRLSSPRTGRLPVSCCLQLQCLYQRVPVFSARSPVLPRCRQKRGEKRGEKGREGDAVGKRKKARNE